MGMRRGRTERRAPIARFKSDDPPIDYKDIELLSKFIGPQGHMLSRRRTGLDTRRQREMKKAIKRARHLALLPFVA